MENALWGLIGVAVGAILGFVNSLDSWRRSEAVAARTRLAEVWGRIWQDPTDRAKRELQDLLTEVEVRCAGIGIDPNHVRRVAHKASQLQGYVDADVDVDAIGRGELIYHAVQAPDGLVEETWQLIQQVDNECAKKAKPWRLGKTLPLHPPYKPLDR